MGIVYVLVRSLMECLFVLNRFNIISSYCPSGHVLCIDPIIK